MSASRVQLDWNLPLRRMRMMRHHQHLSGFVANSHYLCARSIPNYGSMRVACVSPAKESKDMPAGLIELTPELTGRCRVEQGEVGSTLGIKDLGLVGLMSSLLGLPSRCPYLLVGENSARGTPHPPWATVG